MRDFEFQNDKVVNEMGRDGLTEHNLNTGENVRVSNRFQDFSYSDNGIRRQGFKGKNYQGEADNRASPKTFRQQRYAEQVRHTQKSADYIDKKYQKGSLKLQKKEAHMRKNRKLTELHRVNVKVYDYKAYGNLGRPKDYEGEEHFKYNKRLKFDRKIKLHRTKDLVPTRLVKGGGRALLRKGEKAYFEAEGNDNTLAISHELYRTAKPVYRKMRRTVSHPIAKLRNRSYIKLKQKVHKYSDKADHLADKLDKRKFKLEMENAWVKYANENNIQAQSVKNQIKKKMQYKHTYRKQHDRTLVQNIKNRFHAAVKKTKEVIIRNIKKIISLGILILIILLIISAMTSCVTMVANFVTQGAAEYTAGLFVTGFDCITDCDKYFSELLCSLQNDILEIKELNPDYDEYQYFVNGEESKMLIP